MIVMPVFESKRKVQATGSSLSITLPAFFVKANEVEKGSLLKVFYNLDGVMIVSCGDDSEAMLKHLTSIQSMLNEKVNMKRAEDERANEREN